MSTTKLGVALVGSMALALGAAWAWSSMTTSGRLHDFYAGVHAIGYERGGRLPSDAQVARAVEALAAEHALELWDLSVRSHEESGLGPGLSSAAAGALGSIAQGRVRIYEIRASARTSALGLSRDAAIEARIELAAGATLTTPRAGPMPRLGAGAELEGAARRGM